MSKTVKEYVSEIEDAPHIPMMSKYKVPVYTKGILSLDIYDIDGGNVIDFTMSDEQFAELKEILVNKGYDEAWLESVFLKNIQDEKRASFWSLYF